MSLKALFSFTTGTDFRVLIPGTASLLVSSIAPSINSVLYGKILAKLSHFYRSSLERDQFISEVRTLIGALFAVAASKLITYWLGIYLWLIFGENQANRARAEIFSRLIGYKQEELDKTTNFTGTLAQVHRAVEELREGCSENLGLLVETFATVVALLITSICISWSVTLVALASAPIVITSCIVFGRLIEKNATTENSATAMCSKILNWNTRWQQQVKFCNAKFHEMIKFNRNSKKSAVAYYKLAASTAGNMAILRLCSLLLLVQIFAFGTYMMSKNQLMINQVVTCISACLNMSLSIGQLSHIFAVINKSVVAARLIKDFIEHEAVEETSKFVPNSVLETLEAKGVSFSYHTRPDVYAVDNLNLEIKHGINFILGKSGSGKSTVGQLLSGLLQPQKGLVIINGYDIKNLDTNWLQDNIMYLPQFPAIFNDTVYVNVAFGIINRYRNIDEIPTQLVEEAMSFAEIPQHISNEKSNGCHTIIDSSSLSGGQKQRIALARAFLRDPQLLVLDEALSALNKNATKHLLFKIRSWRRNKTTLMILHDEQSVNPEDEIIMIENGHLSNKNILLTPRSPTSQTSGQKKSFSKCLEDSFITKTYTEEDEPDVKYVKSALSITGRLFSELCSKTIYGSGIFFSLVYSGCVPLSSYLVAKLLSNMLDTSIGRSDNLRLWKLIGFIAGVSVIDSISHFGSKFLLSYEAERLLIRIRRIAFANIVEQLLQFFSLDASRPAKLTTLLMNDSRDLRSFLEMYSATILNLVTMVLAGIIWSLVSGPFLALVGLSFLPVVFLVTSFYSWTLAKAETAYKNSIVESEVVVFESAEQLSAIRALLLKNHFTTKFAHTLKGVAKAGIIRAFTVGLGLSLSSFCSSAAVITVFYYGMWLLSEFKYTQNQFFMVVTLLSFTIASASSLLQKMPDIARAQRAGTFLIDLLDMVPLDGETKGILRPVFTAKTPIVFNNVSFAYPDGQRVLKDVSFRMETGDKIALVGDSGSGKSTISLLIERLFPVDYGEIKVCGCKIETLDIEWLRTYVAIVPQLPVFFEGTVLDNLTYGIDGNLVSNCLIAWSLQQAGIYDFIMRLPQGWHTHIGEGTCSRLSGGQMQRLAIARALIRRPKVLIMDEPTGSLDAENTQLIVELIKSIELTLLVITHSTNVSDACNRVLQLKNGYLVEVERTEYSLHGEMKKR